MKKKKKITAKKHIVLAIISCILIFIGILCLLSALWFRKVYGDMDFDSILFTLFSNMDGAESDLLINYLINALLPTIICASAVCFIFFWIPQNILIIKILKKRIKIYPFNRIFISIVSVILSIVTILSASNISGLTDYIIAKSNDGTFYETYYVDPKKVDIQFPNEKRNLIYILLESMETTFYSTAEGGAKEQNVIPNLYNLAQENISFSNTDKGGGLFSSYGTTWTVAAMTAHTSGIHLHIPTGMSSNTLMNYLDEFLPGVTSINDILHDNGYYQALMVGSDCSFGGRREYFTQHGVDKIYDLFTARDEGFIPEDYHVWWGMEDEKLFEYAKQKLTAISSDTSRPFNFTMLTVDTHHIGGYVCPQCKKEHSEQYDNVLSCSDRQIYSFIEWIKAQPFYENTTIIICGDHPTMDGGYIERNVSPTYSRHVYNCIINSPVKPQNTKQRLTTTFDMFPTTLAAMGCKIEGNKLALGTNLFSNEKTILEIIGNHDDLNTGLSHNSDYYTTNFMY